MTSPTNYYFEEKQKGLNACKEKSSSSSSSSTSRSSSTSSSLNECNLDQKQRDKSPHYSHQHPSLYQHVLQQQASQQNIRRRKKRSSVRVNSLNLWDLQQNLDRGDFIEGYLSIAPAPTGHGSGLAAGQPIGPAAGLPVGIVCSPVRIARKDGRLSYYAH